MRIGVDGEVRKVKVYCPPARLDGIPEIAPCAESDTVTAWLGALRGEA